MTNSIAFKEMHYQVYCHLCHKCLRYQEEVVTVTQIQSSMDPRIKEYLERRLSEDERKIVSYSTLST